ncbi:hypothetical protein HYFRA_00014093 [Hymenoscyphus fraxineus]|uniref:Uncharacterized protein n=1 Tax=Hymenoscyphus fraxineus TaxID=746836 RepID=A0A9N9LCY8_9HELO|nr:hypothetical protein HYFRA_00014093 [Hymenoscyphus fraxineus]
MHFSTISLLALGALTTGIIAGRAKYGWCEDKNDLNIPAIFNDEETKKACEQYNTSGCGDCVFGVDKGECSNDAGLLGIRFLGTMAVLWDWDNWDQWDFLWILLDCTIRVAG